MPEADPSDAATVSPPRRRSVMDAFIDGIELIAAFFVGIVAADIFISVMLRYFFSVQIPDAYDFGRLLLGILIFWGIAATSYRGSHITVDLLYANVGERLRRFIDVFATSVLLFVVTVQTYTLFDKVMDTRRDHVLTFDLRLPTWPFFSGGMARRRIRCAFDRGAHVPAHFPSRADGRAISNQAGGMKNRERAVRRCHRPRKRTIQYSPRAKFAPVVGLGGRACTRCAPSRVGQSVGPA